MERKPTDYSKNEALQALKKSIYRRAFLALFLIVLTVVMLFAVTTAWYANVARTSELMFQVATWGFNGNIWVDDQSVIVAGPGDDGNIYLEMENESDSAVSTTVLVDKSSLVPEMRKRLYFYVDTTRIENGENVEKQYLTSYDGYEYTIMGKSNLSLTPAYQNDAGIKWEWVYDVLGYYVYGNLITDVEFTSLADDSEPINNGVTVNIQEYLRPIEYDYNEATTGFINTESGVRMVENINGAPVTTFLANLTANDGYSGKVDAQTAHTPDGFYPVSIDAATGEGVWLYLCNYSEIEAGIAYDTAQGEAALEKQAAGTAVEPMKVTLNIYAEKLELNTKPVATGAEFATAIQSTDLRSIKLTQDMELVTPVTVPANKNVMIDLNGKRLTYNGDGHMVTVLQGATVVFSNGTVVGNGENSGFEVMGSELIMNRVNASQVDSFVTVSDDTVQNDSIVRIVDCVASANSYGVYIIGNGAKSGNHTQVVLENTSIDAGYAGIIANGSEGYHGTDINVTGGRIFGYYTAIYHPQKDSVLKVVNSDLSGMTGIVIKGGAVTLSGTKIDGAGPAQEPDDAQEFSGWTDTGDGIYVCGLYEYPIDVQISSCNVTSAYGYAIRTYGVESENVSVTVHSGNFSSDVGAFVAGSSTMDEGTYEVTVK